MSTGKRSSRPCTAGTSRRRRMVSSRYSLISSLLLQNASNNASCFVPHMPIIDHNSPSLSTKLFSAPIQSSSVNTSKFSPLMSQLPNLFPSFSEELISNGFITPTPIQQSSALRAKDGENLLLIAATGSGKTLAYLLPALSRAACNNQGDRKTIIICAPTRELSAQLARDASLLLPDEGDTPNILLAVRSIPPPTPIEMANAQVLIGTPNELLAVLTRISGAQNFIAGDTLSSVILDEVDVLFPPTPKTLRTSFDKRSDAKNERRAREQKRKLRAAQRRGVEFGGGTNKKAAEGDGQVLSPTEKLLRLIASARFVGGDDKDQVQVLAGSATASRTTLDRLNKALRSAAMEVDIIGSDGLQGAWKGNMKACRPDDIKDTGEQPSTAPEDSTHTIRTVTVPSVVDHRYVFLPKSEAANPQEILTNVAKVSKELKPESSLLFICGEFSRSLLKEKKQEAPKTKGKTSQARRDAERRSVFMAKQKAKDNSGKQSSGPQPLSVRKTCALLQSLGVDAQPMHVVLGLEPNAKEGEISMEENDANDLAENEVDLPQLLVTFEGSARGLHFDGVDVIFVVGRPTSAASYLHLAGRVGRSMANDGTTSGEVEVRPGTIISFCSKGRVTELEKWTNQIGGTKLEELHI